jgi:hypothetical protein
VTLNRSGGLPAFSRRRLAELEAAGSPVYSTFARPSYADLDRQPRQQTRRAPQPTGEANARRLVSNRSGGVCECCGRQTATQWHHRRNRSQSGLWEPANGMHLDADCHHFITVNPTTSYAAGWLVPSWQDPAAVPVWHARLGQVLLDNAGGWAAYEAVGA